jgi:hypothetical protein
MMGLAAVPKHGRLRVLFAATLCVLALCSCTTYYTKPGGTEAQFRKDNYECERDAAQAGLGFGDLAAEGMRSECMEARGYTKAP